MSASYRHKWRKEHAEKIRQERVITEYIRITQPVLYAEANKFYSTLKEKYPDKNDLRKVIEFKMVKPKRVDNMNLQIPLLPLTTSTAAVATTSMTTTSTAAVATTSMTTTSTAAVATTSTSTTTGISDTILDMSDDTVENIIKDLNMSDAMLENMIKELREDPQLCTFLNDVDTDMDIDVVADLGDIDMGTTSPLEQELQLLK